MTVPAIRVRNVAKSYRIWESPAARLGSIALHGLKSIAPPLNNVCGNIQRQFYRDFYAVRDLSLEVSKGEAIGIIGRNGSGKSTLLQIIAGTLAPNVGSVEVEGRVAALLELGSGFNPNYTGRENVFLNASILGLSEEQTKTKFDEIASFADIGDFIDQPVKTYSSGMVVRLAFSVQIAVEPEILIIDEALAVGDEAFQRKCLSRLERMRDLGVTLLFVSHGIQTVVDLCNRCILLHQGRKIAEGAPRDVVIVYQNLLYGSGKVQKLPNAFSRTHNSVNVAPVSKDSVNESDFFDPGLQSSPVIYEEKGARILDIRLTDELGATVNRIRSGKKYCIRYKVIFFETAQKVELGTMIKSLTGQEIAGATTLDSRRSIDRVDSGDSIEVLFSFNCGLLPGAYFIRAGVASVGNDGRLYFLHRIEDAVMIRVSQEQPVLSRGLVDFGFELTIEKKGTPNPSELDLKR